MERNASLEELLREAGWLRSLAGHLVADGARADDLVQETWLAALRAPPPASTPRRAWLARVLRSRAANAHRGDARRARREAEAEPPRAAELPLRAAEAAEAQRLLAEEILALPDEHRTVVVLRYFRGLDSAEIGRELGVPAGTVRWRLSQALEALRGALDRRSGGERSAWAALLVPLAGGEAARAAALPGPGPGALAWLVGLATLTGVAFVVHDRLQEEPAPRPEVVRGESPEPPSSATDGALAARSAAPRSAIDVGAPASPLAIVDEGLEISGVVLLDGAPPVRALELKLARRISALAVPAGTPAPPTPLPESIPPATLRPEEGGAFRFTGLPEGFVGSLRADGYRTREGDERIAVRAPSTGLVLDLVAIPTLRGRVLTAEGAPAASGRGLVLLESGDMEHPAESGSRRSIQFLELNEDGSFAHRLSDFEPDAQVSAVLLLELEAGFLCARASPFEVQEGADLGTLELEPTRLRAVRVLAQDGTPLSGAVARIAGPLRRSRASEPTDVEGWTTLPFAPARAFELRVDALGHASRVLAVDQEDDVEVVLERTCLLVLTLRGVVPGLALHVRGGAELFVPHGHDLEDWEEAELRVELGAAQWNRSDDEELVFPLQTDGPMRITDLRPGHPFGLEVRDATGRTLAARTGILAPGEWSNLELEVAR